MTQPLPPKLDLPQGSATPEQNEALTRYWTLFNDPVLDQLVEEALLNNLDLRASLARIEAARANVLLAQSYLAPEINLNVDAGRSRISSVSSAPIPPGFPTTSNDFRVALNVSYELDVWGKYRSGALAANNDLAASRYYRETVRITVASDVASTYFRLRAADAELVVLEETLKARTDSVRLQRDRYDAGLIGDYDMKQAEAERSAVVADIARAKRGIGQLESALAVLTGRSPRAVFEPQIARGETIDAATEVPSLPSGLPSGLVERRPDIQRAESLLAASDLRVQQARTNYFPAFNLTGDFGSDAAKIGNLFTSPAGIWGIGLGLVQPLLALKAIEAQVELAKANNDQANVEYLQTVQIAFREVHDALVANRRRATRWRRKPTAATTSPSRSTWPRCATTPAARPISRCSTRSARCSRRKHCASSRRAMRACRSSTSPSRWAAAGHPSPTGRSNRRVRRRGAPARAGIASASSAEATISSRLTALSTGLAPSRIRPYIMIVSGGSEPTSISVVLKFSNDIRKASAAAPSSAGRR